MDIYCIVDPSNYVISRLAFSSTDIVPNPHPCYPDCQNILSTGVEQIGWTYVDGAFQAPPVDPNSPPPPPPVSTVSSPPTLESIQAQMAALQAQLATLMAAPPAASSS